MKTAKATRVRGHTRRLLHIGWLALRHYRAYRAFTRLTDDARLHHLDIPRDFAQALLKLGPLWIKLGQILSTRPDILPPAYITALARLQEHVPPFPFAQVRETICEQLHGDIGTLFRSFEETPLASASVAQVHLATLPDGTPVAVKIQRPQVRAQITTDLALLARLIALVGWVCPQTVRRFNLRAGFAEFTRYTFQELDFVREAQTSERFTHNFSDWPDIIIPRVYWPLVTTKVLTMDRVEGLRLKDLIPTLSAQERARLSTRLIEMEMKMFIADGFFHADLHPGNIFFRANGDIALLDFGMYGELSDAHRDHFLLYWYAGLQGQTRRAFAHLIQQTTRLKGADEEAYYMQFKALADQFYGSTIAKRSLTETYLAIIRRGAEFGFVFPSDLLLQAKALTTAEALALALTPDLAFETAMRPILIREFVGRVADGGRLKTLAERVLPELLLFGELPPISLDEPATSDDAFLFDWSSILTLLGERVGALQPHLAVLRPLLDPHAHTALRHAYSRPEVEAILTRTWASYAAKASAVPSQPSMGARWMVHLSALTIAMYEALLAAGQSATGATTLIHDTAWLVYTRMGAIPWAMAGASSGDDYDKLRFSTALFRQFPFDSPAYLFEDVAAAPGVVAFNCLKCPVAEYFRAHDLSDLCVNTWCKLDYPLAHQWGAELQRTGTIASGATVCDFQWQTVPGSAS